MSEPELFGPYRLDTMIGRGGMGEVHRAFDTRRNRVVAVKRMSKHLVTDPEYRKRFRRESALAAMLREPHIIPIHDYGEIDGQLYIDMRLVEGADLGDVLKRVLLTVERAVDVVSQIADALDAAHAEGLVHRDVKPSNALLVGASPEEAASRGFVYLVDFGVAATLGGTTLSRPGLAVGSAAYMAPERMMGDDWDSRVDVYSLACLLYEALTGRRPFPSDDLLTLLQAHMKAPPPRPSDLRPDLPPGMDQVVATGMAKVPNARYSSAGEFAAAARDVLERAPAPPPRNPDDIATVVRRRPAPRPGPARRPTPPPVPIGIPPLPVPDPATELGSVVPPVESLRPPPVTSPPPTPEPPRPAGPPVPAVEPGSSTPDDVGGALPIPTASTTSTPRSTRSPSRCRRARRSRRRGSGPGPRGPARSPRCARRRRRRRRGPRRTPTSGRRRSGPRPSGSRPRRPRRRGGTRGRGEGRGRAGRGGEGRGRAGCRGEGRSRAGCRGEGGGRPLCCGEGRGRRVAAEKAEAERVAAAEKAEAERVAAEKAEAERVAAEKAAAERAEAERVAAEKAAADRAAAERADGRARRVRPRRARPGDHRARGRPGPDVRPGHRDVPGGGVRRPLRPRDRDVADRGAGGGPGDRDVPGRPAAAATVGVRPGDRVRARRRPVRVRTDRAGRRRPDGRVPPGARAVAGAAVAAPASGPAAGRHPRTGHAVRGSGAGPAR